MNEKKDALVLALANYYELSLEDAEKVIDHFTPPKEDTSIDNILKDYIKGLERFTK